MQQGPNKNSNGLFGKLKSKGETTGIQSKIKNLGFQKDISLNELAAAGIKISLKDQLKEQLAKAEETFAERLKKDDSVDQEKPLDGIISSDNVGSKKLENLESMVNQFAKRVNTMAET